MPGGRPGNIQINQISRRTNQAFIQTAPDQVITCIAPPIWVWSDFATTAGAWCVIATTYVDYWNDPSLQDTSIDAGLVLMSTLRAHGDTR